MRLDSVIPIRKDAMWFQGDACPFLGADFQPRFILGSIQARLTREACLGAGGADELQHGFVTHQRLSGPVQANEAEQPMLNGIPFRRPRREVRHRKGQLTFIGQFLQRGFPQPTSRIIGSAIVSLNQQVLLARVGLMADRQPPPADRRDRKCSGLMRDANHDVARIAGRVVDTVGQGFARGFTEKIRLQHVKGPVTPGAPRILEIAESTRASWHRH